ncbi:hypothetical protein [Nesterenkonia alba]|uniref:hypothetical protein n=1 Tax=Nesterenkonia alba TaxID=515814 RepID=UPI0003B4848F|nr:hypothetical protein [Nesterenkonia alba]
MDNRSQLLEALLVEHGPALPQDVVRNTRGDMRRREYVSAAVELFPELAEARVRLSQDHLAQIQKWFTQDDFEEEGYPEVQDYVDRLIAHGFKAAA